MARTNSLRTPKHEQMLAETELKLRSDDGINFMPEWFDALSEAHHDLPNVEVPVYDNVFYLMPISAASYYGWAVHEPMTNDRLDPFFFNTEKEWIEATTAEAWSEHLRVVIPFHDGCCGFGHGDEGGNRLEWWQIRGSIVPEYAKAAI